MVLANALSEWKKLQDKNKLAGLTERHCLVLKHTTIFRGLHCREILLN